MEGKIYELLKSKMEKPVHNMIVQILNAYQMPFDKKIKHYSSIANIFCEETSLIINGLDSGIAKRLPSLENYDPKEQLIYSLMEGLACAMVKNRRITNDRHSN